MGEKLREEAANQLNPPAIDPKAKGKAKAKAASAPSPEPADPPEGPELKLEVGKPLPEIVLRLADKDDNVLAGETGRRFSVSMFRERMVPKTDDPSESEVILREVRFGDMRKVYVDPLDADLPPTSAPGGKVATPPAPAPAPADSDEPEEEVCLGESSIEGVLGDQGEATLGNSEEWLLPVHIQPLIYWISVTDVTDPGSESFSKRLPTLEFPVRVKAAI